MPEVTARDESSFRESVFVLMGANFSKNTLYRLAPPFLGVISRGLGVSLDTIGVALSVAELTGLASPWIGRAIDRRSRHAVMMASLAGLAVGALIAAASPHVVVYGAGLVIVAVCATAVAAALSTWIADRVPYERRGRVTGQVEMSWAGALLVGIPLLAIFVSLVSWRMGYVGAALICLAMLFVVRAKLEPDPPHATHARPHEKIRLASRAVAPALLGFGGLMTANFFVIVVFGVWLEDAFGLSSTQIGVVSFVLGGAELLASSSSSRLTDRLGKRRSISSGVALMVPTAVAMAFLHHQTLLGVALLFVFVLGFEFALVSSLPLIGELQPNARAAMAGYALGLGTIGRGIASIVSTRFYTAHGIGGSSLTAAGIAVVTIALLRAVREPERTTLPR